MPTAPLVTVLLAVHDGEPYVGAALASVLGQTVSDLEVVVVDDASGDRTPEILEAVRDDRLRILRNDVQRGLAASLNRGLDEARGTYVARLDADDVAMPRRLELQVERIRSTHELAIVGSAVMEIDAAWRLGRVHAMPAGPDEVRWAALFSSPFFHPSVLVERDLLERHGLRYDTDFRESEDYELWSRLLDVADGDNLREPLVLYRVHEQQASRRRQELQRELQLRVARQRISSLVPALDGEDVDLAWAVGAAAPVERDHASAAADAYLALVEAFERSGSSARETAARDLMRLARAADSPRIAREALRLDPALPVHVAARRRSRGATSSRAEAGEWIERVAAANGGGGRPMRVVAIFPEPTPYRAPLLDRIAASPGVDLAVVYAAGTVAGRTWRVEPRHRATYLRGLRLPGARRLLHHDYPVTPGVVSALSELQPDVVVVSGWSTFAAQAAIAWCGLRDVPYLLVVESHDEGPRSGWRRTVKGTVVPPIVERAAGLLVTGSLARDSMVARGAHPERVRIFANTVDVEEFGRRVDELAADRPALRSALGVGEEDVIVLSDARLAPEKGLETLVRAVARAGDSRIALVLAGEGSERARIEGLARELGVRLVLAGDVDWERIVELYAAADVFALLSEREPWAVVVNEATACGLPLVLTDRVGAAHDLLRDGENGAVVAAGDVDGAATALRALAGDPALRRRQGARSRELARDWGYGPSVDGFLEAVREAAQDRG